MMSYPVVPGSRTQVLSGNDYTNCTAACCLQNRVPLVAFDIWNELSGRQGRRGRAAGRSKKVRGKWARDDRVAAEEPRRLRVRG